LGVLKCQFEPGKLDENLIKNEDEIHFIINCDNRKTLRFKSNKHVKHVDVVSGGIGMTMVVKVIGCKVQKSLHFS
jgi:hypothetical protein